MLQRCDSVRRRDDVLPCTACERQAPIRTRIWERLRLDTSAVEHINLPWEILMALQQTFVVKDSRYYPFRVRSVNSNLVIGLTMHLRDKG